MIFVLFFYILSGLIHYKIFIFSGLDEKILHECIKYFESCLDKIPARKAFRNVYSQAGGGEFI